MCNVFVVVCVCVHVCVHVCACVSGGHCYLLSSQYTGEVWFIGKVETCSNVGIPF